jgi:hypothetical protein
LNRKIADSWRWDLRWFRELFGWERDMVDTMMAKLQSINFREGRRDVVVWEEEESNNYSGKSAYKKAINGERSEEEDFQSKKLWNKVIPAKVSVFAWQVMQNRIPTKDNLGKRRIIGRDELQCIGGCGNVESSDHLFFAFPMSLKICCKILQWLGVQTVLHNRCNNHLKAFSGLVRSSKCVAQGLEVIWFASIWSIWRARNGRIFKNKVVDVKATADTIKLLSWNWLRSKSSKFSYDWSQWFKPFSVHRSIRHKFKAFVIGDLLLLLLQHSMLLWQGVRARCVRSDDPCLYLFYSVSAGCRYLDWRLRLC